MSKNLKLKLTIDADGNVRGVVRSINNDLAKTESQTKTLNKATDNLGASLQRIGHYGAIAFAGFQLSNVISDTISTADAYASLQGQLKLVTESHAELAYVQNELKAISNETRADISSAVSLYSALSPTFKELGKNTSESTQLIELFNKSLALTSPNATQASAATLQFSQAMGSGVLRGDEFNSVMENGRGIALMLAEDLGKPIGALRSMAEQGELTTEVVVSALERQADVIEEKFTQIPLTVSGAWQNMRTNTMLYIGDVDQAITSSSTLAESIDLIAQNVDVVATVIGGTLVVATSAAIGKMTQYTAAKVADMQATSKARSADLARLGSLKAIALAEQQASVAILQKTSAQKSAAAYTPLASEAERAYATAARNARISADNLRTSTLAYNQVAKTTTPVVRALSGVYALLGGPVGVVTLGAMAVFSFREELGLVAPEAIDAKNALNELTRDVETLTRAQAKQRLLQSQPAYDQAIADVKAYELEIKQVNAKLRYSYTLSTEKVKEYREELINAQGNLDSAKQTVEKYVQIQQQLNGIIKDSEADQKKATKATGDYIMMLNEQIDGFQHLSDEEKALAEARKNAAERRVKDHKEWIEYADDELDLIDQQNKALLEKANLYKGFDSAFDAEQRAITEIQNLYALGLITYEQMQDALFRAAEASTGLSESVESTSAVVKKVAEQANPFAKAWENAFDRIDNDAAAMFRNFDFTAKSTFDVVENAFKNMLAEMAYAATIQPLIVGVQGAMTGNGVGGSSDLFGSISNAYSMSSNLMSGSLFGSSIYGGLAQAGLTTAYGAGGFGAANSVIGTLAQSGNYAGAASYAAGSYLPVIGGAYYGYQQNGVAGGLASGAGAYYGAQLGTAILPGIGTAIGSLLGAVGGNELISGIFGGDWKTKDTGLSLAASLSGVDADYYQYQKKDGGWFSSDKKRTQYTDATEIESSLSDIVALALTNLDANANALGLDLADNFSVVIKESFKGLDESEIQAKVQEMLVDIYTQAADSIDGLDAIVAPLAASGETAADTLARVITQFNTVDGTLERLGANLGDLSENGLAAAQNIVTLVGSLDDFVALSQTYYANFYSDVEQFADLTQSLKDQLSAVNLVLPSTRDAYRDLVEQLQNGTIAEQEQVAALLSLNEAASQYYDTLEARQTDLLASVQSAYDAYLSQSQSIKYGLIALLSDEEQLALTRSQELEQLDPLLQAQQERLWALQDEADKIESLNAVWNSFKSQLSDVKDYLYGTFANIKTFTASIVLGGAVASGAAYADQLELANANDRTALSSITQTAQQYIDSSGITDPAALNMLKAQIAADLNGLTQVSAEEFLASEISKSLAAQTIDLSASIATLPAGLQAVVSSSEYQVQTLIDFAVNDDQMPVDLRAVLLESITGFERVIGLTIDVAGMTDRMQALIVTDNLQATATLNALLSSNTPPALISAVIDGEIQSQAIINTVLSDGNLSAIDSLVLDKTIDASATIDAVLNADTDQAIKALIIEDSKSYLAKLQAVIDGNYSDEEAQRLIGIEDSIYKQAVLYATLGDSLSTDQRALLYATDDSITKLITASGGTLTDAQKAILNALSGSSTAVLDATVALSGQDLTDIEGNTANIADQALEQLSALGTLDATMRDMVNPLVGVQDAMLSLEDILIDIYAMQATDKQVSNLNVEAQDLMRVISTLQSDASVYEAIIGTADQSIIDRIDARVKVHTDAFSSSSADANAIKAGELATVGDIAGLEKLMSDTDSPWVSEYIALAEKVIASIDSRSDYASSQISALNDDIYVKESQLETIRKQLIALGVVPEFADGGYTAAIARDQIAGVVHGGEYVAPGWMIDKYPDLFASLEEERTRGYATGGPVSFNMPTFANNDTPLLKELREMNQKLDKLIKTSSNEEATKLLKEINQRQKSWHLKGLPPTRITVGTVA